MSLLKRYVVLRQSFAAAEVFLRDAGGEWTHALFTTEGALGMPQIEGRPPLAEIYEDVEFSA